MDTATSTATSTAIPAELESAIAERIAEHVERLIPRWIRLGYELRVTEEAGEPLVVSMEDLIGYVAEDENFWD